MRISAIKQWNTFAGGTDAAEGKRSYSTETRHGEYHIFPATSRGGRHLGYDLRFAATKHAPLSSDKTMTLHGLWHELGRFRTPAEAVKAARSFEQARFVGV